MLVYFLPILGYLLGSISFSYHITKLLKGADIRTLGIKNTGTKNVYLSVGKVPALLTLIFDLGKGMGIVLLSYAAGAPDFIVMASAIAAFLGHVFPFYLQFKGGKGLATLIGIALLLTPVPLLISGGLFLFLRLFLFKNVLANLIALSFLPFLVLYFDQNLVYFLGFLFLISLRWLFDYHHGQT